MSQQCGAARRFAAPGSCAGIGALAGGRYVGTLVMISCGGQPRGGVTSAATGVGSAGADKSGAVMSSADVRSPVTERRHAERFGTSTPKRVSRKRSIDVWSNRSEHTQPPRLNGDSTSIG